MKAETLRRLSQLQNYSGVRPSSGAATSTRAKALGIRELSEERTSLRPRTGALQRLLQLARLIDANPFRSFSVNLADGRALKVPHRDFISHSSNFRMLTVWHEDDSADFMDLMPVVGFHPGRLQRNGHRRRKSSR